MKATAKTGVVGVTLELTLDEAQTLLHYMDFGLDILIENFHDEVDGLDGFTEADVETLQGLHKLIASISIGKK